MNTDPTGAFEYKIIRSNTKAFRTPAFFQQTLQEEAQAGWQLVENSTMAACACGDPSSVAATTPF